MGSTLQGVVLCDKLLGRVTFGADAGGGFLVLKIPPKKNKQSLKYTIKHHIAVWLLGRNHRE